MSIFRSYYSHRVPQSYHNDHHLFTSGRNFFIKTKTKVIHIKNFRTFHVPPISEVAFRTLRFVCMCLPESE